MEEKSSLIGSVGAKQIRSQSLMDRVLPLFYKFGVRLNLSLTFSAAKENKKKSAFCFWNFPSLTREKNICLTCSCLFDLGIGHLYHLHLVSTYRGSAHKIISFATKAFGLLLITVCNQRHLKGLLFWRGYRVEGLVRGSCYATTLGLK